MNAWMNDYCCSFLVQVGEFDLQGLTHSFLWLYAVVQPPRLLHILLFLFYRWSLKLSIKIHDWNFIVNMHFFESDDVLAGILQGKECLSTLIPTSVNSEKSKSKQNPLLPGAIFTLFSHKKNIYLFHWIVCDFSRERSLNCVKDGEALPKYIVPVFFSWMLSLLLADGFFRWPSMTLNQIFIWFILAFIYHSIDDCGPAVWTLCWLALYIRICTYVWQSNLIM